MVENGKWMVRSKRREDGDLQKLDEIYDPCSGLQWPLYRALNCRNPWSSTICQQQNQEIHEPAYCYNKLRSALHEAQLKYHIPAQASSRISFWNF
ncbi:hypothetical protein M9H77_33079 [Catharanthus roseus]|uniref:Uncharacterized protein n=1 Tax=Catharanthus roseus TaxID=4058 RepID=A0ACB9ZHP9_CATRO|nr:hypothetical protein M9H77_33079 [Catharanthus roseus]